MVVSHSGRSKSHKGGVANFLAANLANAALLPADMVTVDLEGSYERFARRESVALDTADEGRREHAGMNAPLKHCRGEVEGVQLMPLDAVHWFKDRAVREIEQEMASRATFVQRSRVLPAKVLELLVGGQHAVPSIGTIVTVLAGVVDGSVIFEAPGAVEEFAFAEIPTREDVVVPRAVDA